MFFEFRLTCHPSKRPRFKRSSGPKKKSFSVVRTAKPFAQQPLAKTKRPTDAGIVIILDGRVQCQFPLGGFWLRKCAGQEDGSVLPG
jgi:hypothetical protein